LRHPFERNVAAGFAIVTSGAVPLVTLASHLVTADGCFAAKADEFVARF